LVRLRPSRKRRFFPGFSPSPHPHFAVDRR